VYPRILCPADADEEIVILCEKGTVESEYDNDFDDGED
jgi:hypothetical protein